LLGLSARTFVFLGGAAFAGRAFRWAVVFFAMQYYVQKYV